MSILAIGNQHPPAGWMDGMWTENTLSLFSSPITNHSELITMVVSYVLIITHLPTYDLVANKCLLTQLPLIFPAYSPTRYTQVLTQVVTSYFSSVRWNQRLFTREVTKVEQLFNGAGVYFMISIHNCLLHNLLFRLGVSKNQSPGHTPDNQQSESYSCTQLFPGSQYSAMAHITSPE